MSKDRKEKMNIAMFGHKHIPSREGGIEIVVEEIATRIVQHGHSVTCFNRSGHHIAGVQFDREKICEYKGIKIKNVFTLKIKGIAAMTASVFGSLYAALGKYDVVHIHAEGPAFMCWLPKMRGKRVVVTIHGLDHQREKWGELASAYIMLGEKTAVRFADEIIVLSNNIKRYFWDTYGRETTFIPNGVNKPVLRKANLIKERWGLKKDSYILYLGRIVPEKGGIYLIKAFKKVETNKKLIIAGGSSDTETFMNELKNLAEDDDRIIFTGFIQGQALEELYSNAYIYTLPSDLEGMPLSLLEGMSYGNCCLTSDIPECSEVVEKNAVLFKKSDVDDLRKNIQLLCDNPEIVTQYKLKSSEFICKKYNWNDVVTKTLELYRK